VVESDRDWTFYTSFNGTTQRFDPSVNATLLHASGSEAVPATLRAQSEPVVVESECGDRIPFDKLKRRDPILFYDEVTLFEDELHDFGMTVCNVKLVCWGLATAMLGPCLTCFTLCLMKRNCSG